MTLAGARVLVTRAAEDAPELEDLLRERGAVPLRMPCIAFEDGPDTARIASVLRERQADLIVVASPNAGTPLATPERWDQTVGWLANLLELFPENPFTTGASFVADAIVWLARHAVVDILHRPGLLPEDLAPRWYSIGCAVYDVYLGALCYLPMLKR